MSILTEVVSEEALQARVAELVMIRDDHFQARVFGRLNCVDAGDAVEKHYFNCGCRLVGSDLLSLFQAW